MNLYREITEAILKELDSDIQAHFMKWDEKERAPAYTLFADPALIALKWQELRNRKSKLPNNN